MTDLNWYNAESVEERQARRQRAELVTSGERGRDGLTDGERELIARLHRQALSLTQGMGERSASRDRRIA